MRLAPRPALLRAAAIALSFGSVATLTAGPASADPPVNQGAIGGEQLSAPGRQVNLGAGARPLPAIWADSWVLADVNTGQILAAKQAHLQRAPASTLKTLTALTVLPQLSMDQAYLATDGDANTYGSRVGLKPGKTYTVRDLFYGLILPSGNDAALALARAAGSVAETVAQMNETAARLQAADTLAKNPSGLDAPGQVTSAYDLALFGRASLTFPEIIEIASTKRYEFPWRGQRTRTIYNENRLLLSGYKGMIGLKTGYTTNAGRTFIGLAQRGDRTLVVALMGIHEATADAARKALTWGFENEEFVTPVGELVDPLTDAELAATRAATALDVSTSSNAEVSVTTGRSANSGDEQSIIAAGPTTEPFGIFSAPWWLWAFIALGAIFAFPLIRQRHKSNAVVDRGQSLVSGGARLVRPDSHELQ
ncbi:MAG: D-alanyl-D-alanine carboxypeptidase [Actinobacteria bacterium]|nr:MAG: D-alanyl-D-alanine carboxypeptidase [Actinomycetota bacterium]